MPNHEEYYSPSQDPYLNQDTGILLNIPNLRTSKELERFEEVMFQANFWDATKFTENANEFSLDLWQDIHKICFADVYEWAGQLRTVRIAKDQTVFAYPEHIENEAHKQFEALNELLSNETFTVEKAAEIYAELNVLHPFREGNGRTQRILFSEVFKRMDILLDWGMSNQAEMISAMIAGYNGNYTPTIKLLQNVIVKSEG